MIDSHPYSPVFLTLLALIFVGIVTYMVMYNRRQKNLAKELEHEGHPVHSVDEGILLAQERSHAKHAHGTHKA